MQLKYKVLEGDRVLAACLWLRLLSCRVRGWVALNELLSTFFKSGVLGPELGMDPLMFSTKKEQEQWLSCYSMGVPIVPGLSVVQLNPKMNTTSLSLLRAGSFSSSVLSTHTTHSPWTHFKQRPSVLRWCAI